MYNPAVVEQSIKLLQEGFSEEQIVSLLRLRRRVEKEHDLDVPPEFKRLKFARWCVEHDALHE